MMKLNIKKSEHDKIVEEIADNFRKKGYKIISCNEWFESKQDRIKKHYGFRPDILIEKDGDYSHP